MSPAHSQCGTNSEAMRRIDAGHQAPAACNSALDAGGATAPLDALGAAEAGLQAGDRPHERAQSRPQVLRQILAVSLDSLFRFLMARLAGDRAAAEDLLQQTCVQAAKHRSPPSSADECEAWLRGIARNLVRHYWRDRKRDSRLQPLQNPAIAASLADRLEQPPVQQSWAGDEQSKQQLLLAVTSLGTADQQLIYWRYFDARTLADIAGDLRVTVKSVESRLYRVRSRLRETLRQTGRSGGP